MVLPRTLEEKLVDAEDNCKRQAARITELEAEIARLNLEKVAAASIEQTHFPMPRSKRRRYSPVVPSSCPFSNVSTTASLRLNQFLVWHRCPCPQAWQHPRLAWGTILLYLPDTCSVSVAARLSFSLHLSTVLLEDWFEDQNLTLFIFFSRTTSIRSASSRIFLMLF